MKQMKLFWIFVLILLVFTISVEGVEYDASTNIYRLEKANTFDKILFAIGIGEPYYTQDGIYKLNQDIIVKQEILSTGIETPLDSALFRYPEKSAKVGDKIGYCAFVKWEGNQGETFTKADIKVEVNGVKKTGTVSGTFKVDSTAGRGNNWVCYYETLSEAKTYQYTYVAVDAYRTLSKITQGWAYINWKVTAVAEKTCTAERFCKGEFSIFRDEDCLTKGQLLCNYGCDTTTGNCKPQPAETTTEQPTDETVTETPTLGDCNNDAVCDEFESCECGDCTQETFCAPLGEGAEGSGEDITDGGELIVEGEDYMNKNGGTSGEEGVLSDNTTNIIVTSVILGLIILIIGIFIYKQRRKK